MGIEERFDISLISALALKEKQLYQNDRSIIAVHGWFARRPGTLFRGLVLAEFSDEPLAETFFRANDFPGRVVADPFMGAAHRYILVLRFTELGSVLRVDGLSCPWSREVSTSPASRDRKRGHGKGWCGWPSGARVRC